MRPPFAGGPTSDPAWWARTTSPSRSGPWSAIAAPAGPRTPPCTGAPAASSSMRRFPPRSAARTAGRAWPGSGRLAARPHDDLLDHPDRVELAEELVRPGLGELLAEGLAAEESVGGEPLGP